MRGCAYGSCRTTITASRCSTHPPAATWAPPKSPAKRARSRSARPRAARAARRRLRKDLAAAQQERYGAQTRPGRPERLKTLTAQEAGRELAEEKTVDLSGLALPDLIPPSAPPADWRTPPSLAARTRQGLGAPVTDQAAGDAGGPDGGEQ